MKNKKRQRMIAVFAFLALSMFWPGIGQAQEKNSPDEIVTGIAKLTLNQSWASVTVNGESWDDQYFEKNGKLLILQNLKRAAEYTITLTALEERFKPAVLNITNKDWKLRRIDKRTRQWQIVQSIKFKEWKKGEKEAMEKKASE